jgi:hypothetical protein
MVVPSEIGRRPAAVLPVSFEWRSTVVPRLHPSFVAAVEPRQTIEPFKAIGRAQFDHVATVSRIAELDPHVPEPGGLQERFVAGISQRPAERGEFATVGRGEPLIGFHRLLELSPRLVRQLEHLLPAGSQRLATEAVRVECPQRLDGGIEFLGIGPHAGLRLRPWRTARRRIVAFGDLLQKGHRSRLAEQVDVLCDRQVGEDAEIRIRRRGPARDDADEE